MARCEKSTSDVTVISTQIHLPTCQAILSSLSVPSPPTTAILIVVDLLCQYRVTSQPSGAQLGRKGNERHPEMDEGTWAHHVRTGRRVSVARCRLNYIRQILLLALLGG